ncbi:MAG: hypothetical protein MMC23_000786 [Stictis urceolatum]|nr:hypothetical protein [Stictis urceolata]
MHSLAVIGLLAASASAAAVPQGLKSSSITKRDDSVHLPFINGIDASYNIPLKQWNQQLVDNAYKTVMDNQGQTEIHELNPGSLAQVLSPGRYDQNPSTGGYDPFELIYWAWLCEVPDDPQLGGRCPQVLADASLTVSETGHHDILTSPDYTQIGCAFFQNPTQTDPNSPFQGIWGCDLA